MKTFDFYQDRKVTCWERTHFSVKTENYDKALEIIQSWKGEDVLNFSDDTKIIITDGGTLHETSESLYRKTMKVTRLSKYLSTVEKK